MTDPIKKSLRDVAVFLVGSGLFFILLFKALVFILHKAPEPIGSRADLFYEGAKMTLVLTLCSGSAGVVIGMVAGLLKLSPRRWLRLPADFFVWVVRGTPLLVQIFFVYYALPALVPAFEKYINEMVAAGIALSLNVGAYNAEVVRAGIEAVAKGQREAAKSLGLTSMQTMRFIVLPQAIRIVVPPLINNVVALLKDSSLASSIGLLELSLAGNRISAETFLPVPVLTTVAVIYLVLTTAVTTLTQFIEKRMKVASR